MRPVRGASRVRFGSKWPVSAVPARAAALSPFRLRAMTAVRLRCIRGRTRLPHNDKDGKGRKRMSVFSRPIFGGLAIAALLATGSVHAAPDKDHVIAAVGWDVTTIDPHKISGGSDYMFFSNVFEGLYGHDLDGKLTPELAVSYEQSDDGLTYTFKLRPDVKFHNGDPLTAEDRSEEPTSELQSLMRISYAVFCL